MGGIEGQCAGFRDAARPQHLSTDACSVVGTPSGKPGFTCAAPLPQRLAWIGPSLSGIPLKRDAFVTRRGMPTLFVPIGSVCASFGLSPEA
jgi:hypothetical protein